MAFPQQKRGRTWSSRGSRRRYGEEVEISLRPVLKVEVLDKPASGEKGELGKVPGELSHQ